MPLEVYYRGQKHEIVAYHSTAGSAQAIEFVDGLQDRERRKVVALLQRSADIGPPFNNSQHCKPVEGTKFFELKSHQVRLFWRWLPGGRIVLMCGFIKKQDKIAKSDLALGLRLFAEIEDELGN